jgi:hypothetical protein
VKILENKHKLYVHEGNADYFQNPLFEFWNIPWILIITYGREEQVYVKSLQPWTALSFICACAEERNILQ